MRRKKSGPVLLALAAACFVCLSPAGAQAAPGSGSTFAEKVIQSSSAYVVLKGLCTHGHTVVLAHFGASPEVVADWNEGMLAKELPRPHATLYSLAAGPAELVDAVRALKDRCIPAAKAIAAAASSRQAGSEPSGGLRTITHKVAQGESLSAIAQKYAVSVDTIMWSNSLSNPNRLKIGQILRFPSISGVVHLVTRGESIWTIAKKYGVSRDEIVRANQLDEPDKLKLKQALVIPGAKPLPVRSSPVAVASRGSAGSRSSATSLSSSSSASASSSRDALAWPLSGRISSRFGRRWGRMHNGLDIAVPTGTPVRAAADGCVIFAGWRSGYGRLVILDHGGGVQTYYGHNSSFAASVGDAVAAGDRIALSGNSGVSTGPHLHFEVRVNGKARDPLEYLN